jgi:replication-associated recombination protein RarA
MASSKKKTESELAVQPEKPDSTTKQEPSLTKNGYAFDEVTSSFHKEIRLGNEEAALFWGFELYEAAPYYFWKRLLIQAAEDVGLADPQVIVQLTALAQAWDFCKKHSRFYVDPEHVAMAILLLARAPKGAEVDDAKNLVEQRKKAGWRLEVEDYSLDAHTLRGRAMGRKDWADFYRFRERYLTTRNAYFEKLQAEFPAFIQGHGD